MELKYKLEYPKSDLYEYESYIERINLDKERESDILNNRGFAVSEPKSIKKDVKELDGIFSTRFGHGLQDEHAYADRFRCTCGALRSIINNNIKCPICKTRVTHVDDDFGYFGWITLKDPFYIIHQGLYKSVASLIGEKKLLQMLEIVDDKDQDGYSIETVKSTTDPYIGIGMIEFKEKFDEIIEWAVSKNPKKQAVYEDIILNRNKIFTQSIPVFTIHLRPYRIEGDSMFFEGTNALYNIINKLASSINNDSLSINKKTKPKNHLLFDLQMKVMKLYKELESIISGKKGSIRSLFGGRYNFTGRSVITLDPSLRIDQIRLPYKFLIEILQQSIINILHKAYSMSYDEAYIYWYKATLRERDETIIKIIESMIENSEEGLPMMINRNPTIQYGSILQMFCIGINFNYSMSLPFGVLTDLAADFDGDSLNILYIINKDFFRAVNAVFNPRNAMSISKNDGYVNAGVLPMKDTLINSNTLVYLSRCNYTQEQIDKLNSLLEGE